MHLDNVESFYPLSPAQQGILFHSVYDPSAHEYFGQLGFTFYERVDVAAFEKAWRSVLQRHAVLRTFFIWEGLPEPVQVVRLQFEVEVAELDWRDIPAEKQQAKLDLFLKEDQDRGLDLGKAPLMRFTLIRLQEDCYRFVWSHHHILIDGWSAPIVLNDFLSFYVSYRDSTKLELPVQRPYRDYIAWLAKQDRQKAEIHWRKLLQGFKSPTPLGLERAVPQAETPGNSASAADSGDQTLELGPELLSSLQELGRKQRLTLNTIVQGAWAILLNRYSGEENLVYGATVSGRPAELEGSDGIVGLFINTLPVRVRVDGAARVIDLLREMQEQQVETRQYEYSRLVDVQTWSDVGAGKALFNSIFVFENYPVRKISGETNNALKVGDLSFRQKTNYALTIAAGLGDKLALRALYDSRKYTAETIRRLLGHLANLLAEIAASTEQQTSALEILSPEEREQILEAWNGRTSSYPCDLSITRQFEKTADKHHDRIAVWDDNEQLTYKQLDERSNQLAHYLKKKGAGAEQIVGLCLERGVRLAIGLLAILKAGGAYLPLDSKYPSARLRYMLSDSGARLVVTESKFASQIANEGLNLVLIDEEQGSIAAGSTERLADSVAGENLAYLIYTSGTTGLPKGVMVQHNSLSNLAPAMAEGFHITPESRVLQFASLSFDASVAEIFPSLLTGAMLHMASSQALRPGMDLIATLQERQISFVILSPSILGVLPDEHLPHLKTIVVAGEACSEEVATRWSKGHELIDAYGPTETTVCASMSEPLQSHEAPHIGAPLANGRVYILDSHLNPVPVGVAGEIYVGGALLARGYHNRPDVTAERFVPDPFSRVPGARIYKTGDLARFRSDGNIEYIGRSDEQIKLRGFRIEPGEIETLLEQDPRVGKAIAIVREDVPGDKRLVAYIQTSGEKPSVSELNDMLRAKVPDYMMPSAIIALDAFPLTVNGKVDRQALPAPDGSRQHDSATFLDPRNEAERTIAKIWCDVLRLEKVGVQENFFDLGGHSLLMLQVHGKLKEAFPKDISMLQMFGHPTVSSLAEYFTQAEPQVKTGKTAFSSIQERVKRQKEMLKKRTAQRELVSATDAPVS